MSGYIWLTNGGQRVSGDSASAASLEEVGVDEVEHPFVEV